MTTSESSDTAQPAGEQASSPAKRGVRFRFGTRWLLAVVTVCGVALGVAFHPWWNLYREVEIAEQITQHGGSVTFDYTSPDGETPQTSWDWIFQQIAGARPGHVQSCTLIGENVTAGDLPLLAELPQLSRVRLQGEGITDQELDALANVTSLREVELDETAIFDPRTIKSLGKIPTLETLVCRGENIGDKEVREISQFPKLKSLTLESSWCTTWGMQDLKSSKTLQHLELIHCQSVGSYSVELISELPNLRSFALADLDLGDLYSASEVMQGIARASALESLSTTQINVCPGDLSRLEPLDNLHHLSLHRCYVRDPQVAELTKLDSLEWLDLSANRITDVSIPSLLALPKLRYVDLSQTELTAAGVKQLTTHPGLETIAFSAAGYQGPGKITTPEIEAITKANPQLSIVWQP
ncbi:leucine-rich repeat domain-containing protein [Blastopirellula marina]|uniref:Disease resistance R13L4/SHOC-2-like LRR domain-containing protein n=1 Tax=Blastopirellula marina TaxID=124 RepID=A0A2S8GLQ9_9BACT|nr:leucine-rich repeat domain-containing protein [Blastopirellula marina]PQO45360.1 hypothetical protein C5Y93_12930 [Blastopirellula marina]